MSRKTIAATAAFGLATAGLVAVPATAHADDDRRIKIVARAGYGETIKGAMRLDG